MAVIVDFLVPEASLEQMHAVEGLTVARGAAAGRPPYQGCMFIAVTATDRGFRFVSAWRSEEAFRSVLAGMLEPDLATVGLRAESIRVAPAVSMALPQT